MKLTIQISNESREIELRRGRDGLCSAYVYDTARRDTFGNEPTTLLYRFDIDPRLAAVVSSFLS